MIVDIYLNKRNHMKQGKVLVSGASGFVASHIINGLLNAGYDVVGTVRSLANK